jgi:TonB family protein
MRRLFIIFAIMVAISSYAQDIIITNKAQKIDAKILEASVSEIKYKKIDNIDGPTYTLHTDEINSIIYANGKVVLYNQPKIEEESDRERDKPKKPIEFIDNLFGSTGTAGEEPADGMPIGRGAISIPKPEMNRVESGIVIVEVLVDQNGNVVRASIAKGTTITDKQTLLSVLEAAKKAKFSKGYGKRVERIPYRLELH